jgi:hypothetical protein
MEEKLAVLQMTTEIADGEIDGMGEKADIDRLHRSRETDLKKRARRTRLNWGWHGTGLAPRGTFPGHDSNGATAMILSSSGFPQIEPAKPGSG